MGGRNEKRTKIFNLIKRVNDNNTGVFNRNSELIVILPDSIATIIGDSRIYLSEFVIAKIKGHIGNNSGHPEITDDILERLPESLCNPFRIYEDNRIPHRKKYLFIKIDPAHQIVVEINRRESGKTEINTVIPMGDRSIKQLEDNEALQAVLR